MPPLLCQSLVLGLSTPSTTEALERHESIIKLRLQKADIDNNHRIRLFCRDEVGPHVRRHRWSLFALTNAAFAPTPQGDAALRTLKEFEAGLQLPQPSKVGLSVTHHVVQTIP